MEGEWIEGNCESFVIPLSEIQTVGGRPKNFICSFEGCDASFNKAWKLDAHLCKHTGEKPFVCDYKGCGKGFTRNYHLTRHQLIHGGEKPFQCPNDGCNAAFSTKSNLKRHTENKHGNQDAPYVCDFEACGKAFKKHQQLKIHQCEHTNLLPFECDYEGCNKRFPVPSKLRRHKKIHKGYACEKEDCSFVGKTWTEYQKHLKDRHTEKFICELCNKTFKRKDFLKQHQKTHDQHREVFRCPHEGCGRTYTTTFNLQSHILSFHEERREYVCRQPGCGKAFAMKFFPLPKKRPPRPKRSLASRLSGYVPPKNPSKAESSTLTALLKNTTITSISLNGMDL
nr:PREDICTED: transcription factor IIIA [Latimeria chalumnae]|eukprot:XP_014342108.1 PREDICTED: transcription factor IIIA [Latimeria chalumnae]